MSYAKLEAHHRKLSHLQHLNAIVGWDEAVMMPEGGGDKRNDALATLRVMIHEMASAPQLGDWIAKAEAEAGLSPWQRSNVREARRLWLRETALPTDLVEASSKAASRSEQTWRKLRAANDWQSFRPLLEEVTRLQRETASALGSALGLEPYDALVDGYEPGMRSADIDRLFAELRGFLPSLIERAASRPHPVVAPPPPFPIEAQRAIGQRMMSACGFDFLHGRLDTSHHPFCGGVPSDVRITTRYDERDFHSALMAVLHETGHGKYEQGLPRDWTEQPVGQARSMGVHESQSLFQEMQVCRSREFFVFAAPHIGEAFGEARRLAPDAFSADNLYRTATRCKPGLIRVDADEVTYPGHIVLRYELERGLIEGRLAVRDLPNAWDAEMQRWFKLSTRGNDRDGCMQDVHWPAGLFGYFPSYTLGALIAAQLFAAAQRDVPELRAQVSRGDFAPLNAWLSARVWSQASFLETPALIAHATGEPLSARHFQAHLEARYL